MKTLKKTTIFLGCMAACAVILSGCAGERKGPFDVPGAVPSSSGSGGYAGAGGYPGGATGTYTGQAPVSGDVARAAAEISAAKVYFAFDRADIRPEATATLDRVAVVLKQYPSIRISIQGHTDERGGSEYNYKLGERRARAAYRYLMNAGVPARQVDMVTFGKHTPAVAGHAESAWSRNRRAEFIVLTTCY